MQLLLTLAGLAALILLFGDGSVWRRPSVPARPSPPDEHPADSAADPATRTVR
ncbi:MAG: hypothetical protein ABSB75_02605 [Candidatus Limnocylindrales bacterium]